MDRLTVADIDVLIEAMDAWEVRGLSGAILGSVIGLGLLQSKEEAQVNTDKWLARYEQEKASRSEVVILLKAKLVRLRREIQAREDQEKYPEGTRR